jgi:hypothetical protein
MQTEIIDGYVMVWLDEAPQGAKRQRVVAELKEQSFANEPASWITFGFGLAVHADTAKEIGKLGY